ncbi:hypothetical protein POM88_042977 [Heracleum sosnowskyi]|uniref:Uncharacterized protein n=1 Tax=Heracleum sosnowskyi TaxID=360622 RepID=A0AAD8HHN3_9APIA|nr:hypothetical protein POM88_042977 [Heracleum sosnowskyi]
MSDHGDKISNEESGDPWGNKVERPQGSGWGKKADNGQKKSDAEPKVIWEGKEDRHSEKLSLAWSTKASDQAETPGDKGQLSSGWGDGGSGFEAATTGNKSGGWADAGARHPI